MSNVVSLRKKVNSITLTKPVYTATEYKFNPRLDGGYDIWRRTHGSREQWKAVGIGLSLIEFDKFIMSGE